MTPTQHRLLQAARTASHNLPQQYRAMIDCLLMMTGKRRDGSRPLLTLTGDKHVRT